jgi:hypothetical protein
MRAPLSGLVAPKFFAQGHQAGHFGLGQLNFFAAPRCKRKVFYAVFARGVGKFAAGNPRRQLGFCECCHGCYGNE